MNITPSLSVLTVFFDVYYHDLALTSNYAEEKERLEQVKRKLIHSEPYIKGKLTKTAGLRYAPDIKFVPYKFGGSPLQAIVIKK